MKYIDTHAHLNLAAFTEDVDVVLSQCVADEVAIINVGTGETSSKRAVEIANGTFNQASERNSGKISDISERAQVAPGGDNCYAIIGLHPIYTVSGREDEDSPRSGIESFNPDFYRELAKAPKVVGVGECGFDYWHTAPDSYEAQEKNFIAQIQFANEHNLPLMIHTRNPKPGEASPTGRSVYEDVYEVLKQYAKVPFNVHFYAGTYDEAKKFFDIGGTVSFTGVITFASVYEEVVKAVPLELMHGETDCPYVAPVPHRGKRAEPWMVIEVYKKIAAIKRMDEEVVRQQLVENAKRFYRI